MEIFLLIVILIFVIIIYNKNHSNHQSTQDSIRLLQQKIDKLKSELHQQSTEEKTEVKPTFAEEKKPETIFPTSEVAPAITPTAEEPKTDLPENSSKVAEKAIAEDLTTEKEQKVAFSVQEKINTADTDIQKTPSPRTSWLKKFRENNPDIEKFIGENLINKIGILILVLGISFFVKYAIDKDWINEPARVGIGILSGAIVMAVAHRLRKNYAAFSSVFVAGAISIFYLTIGIAFHDYKLFTQTVAFIIMIVITIFSVLVSVSYNRKELAILSLIGGFAVPFMVSTGEGNYKVLLTYIAILNIGMLIISYFKKWNIVTLLAFLFTCMLYSGWFGISFYETKVPYRGALFFATLFYLIFSIAAVIHNLRNKGTFTKIEYFIMVANTFFYFGMGVGILENWKPELKGLFTVALAFYNLIYAIFLYRKFGLDKNAIYLLLGLTLTFVTLAIPIQFQGNYITLFWAGEAVLLFWLSQKSKINTFILGAIIVQVLMMISLMMDWENNYSTYVIEQKPFLNKIFVTGLVALASLVITYFLLRKSNDKAKLLIFAYKPQYYKNFVLAAAILTGYFTGILEVDDQANNYFSNPYSATSYSVLYHFLFSAGAIFFILKLKNQLWNTFAIVLSALNILLYITVFYNLTYNELINNFVENSSYQSAYIIHYILVICMVYYGYILILLRKENLFGKFLNHKIALWIFALAIVYILSNEVMIHGLMFTRDLITPADLSKFPATKLNEYNYKKEWFIDDKMELIKIQIIKIGYPILWGVLSFVFLIIGIKKQIQQLRIIALALLGITIIKLFVYDIKNVSETGKIIAFILLGVLILIISFVYQKIKRLVVDDSKPKKEESTKEITNSNLNNVGENQKKQNEHNQTNDEKSN